MLGGHHTVPTTSIYSQGQNELANTIGIFKKELLGTVGTYLLAKAILNVLKGSLDAKIDWPQE